MHLSSSQPVFGSQFRKFPSSVRILTRYLYCYICFILAYLRFEIGTLRSAFCRWPVIPSFRSLYFVLSIRFPSLTSIENFVVSFLYLRPTPIELNRIVCSCMSFVLIVFFLKHTCSLNVNDFCHIKCIKNEKKYYCWCLPTASIPAAFFNSPEQPLPLIPPILRIPFLKNQKRVAHCSMETYIYVRA